MFFCSQTLILLIKRQQQMAVAAVVLATAHLMQTYLQDMINLSQETLQMIADQRMDIFYNQQV